MYTSVKLCIIYLLPVYLSSYHIMMYIYVGHRYIELFLNSSGGAEPHFGHEHEPQGSWNGGSTRGGGQVRSYSD